MFDLWVYNDELQFKFTFRSGPMIFGRVMALGLWNLAKYLVITNFFRYAWRYWLDFWYESVFKNHKLQINFEIRSGWMIFGQLTAVGLWNLTKYLVVTTLFHYDLRYWLLPSIIYNGCYYSDHMTLNSEKNSMTIKW